MTDDDLEILSEGKDESDPLVAEENARYIASIRAFPPEARDCLMQGLREFMPEDQWQELSRRVYG